MNKLETNEIYSGRRDPDEEATLKNKAGWKVKNNDAKDENVRMLSAQGYRKKTDAPQRKSNVYALSNVLKQAGGFDERETIDPRRDKVTVTYGTQTDPAPTVS